MDRRKRNIIIMGILVLVLSSIGFTYAIWSRTVEQTGTNIIQLDCFQIEFDENEDSSIHLSNAFPILDSEGEKLTPYHFKVINKCNSYASYQVRIEVKQNSSLNDEYLKVMLNKNYPKILKNENYEVTDVLLGKDTKHAYILETGYLDANETIDYDLRLWLDESVTLESMNSDNIKIENSTWGGIITISSSYASKRTAILANKEIEIVKEGDGLYEVRHDDVSGTVDDLGFSQTEYRYAGSNPNNYVKFNDELWRIIGLVNVLVPQEDGTSKVEQRLKIVRKDSIGDFSWDYKTGGIGSSITNNGSNDWTDSQLMQMLNGAYYNSTSGVCYQGSSAGVSCTFDGTNESYSKGLNDLSRKMIDKKIIWNIGGIDGEYATYNANNAYIIERGNSVYTGTLPWNRPIEWQNDNTRNSTWTLDKSVFNSIGLMYLSDYGYSIGDIAQTRETCLNTHLSTFNSNNCYLNNWLYVNTNEEWFLSPSSYRSDYVFYRYQAGQVGISRGVDYSIAVRPTLYLKSNVIVTNLDNTETDGSSEHPYELALPE